MINTKSSSGKSIGVCIIEKDKITIKHNRKPPLVIEDDDIIKKIFIIYEHNCHFELNS